MTDASVPSLAGPELNEVEHALENLPKLSGWLIEECEGPYSRWAAGFCTDVEGLVQEQAKEIEGLRANLDPLQDVLRFFLDRWGGCENYVKPHTCKSQGRVRGDKFLAEMWCDYCELMERARTKVQVEA